MKEIIAHKDNFIIKLMKKRLKTLLPDNIRTDVVFQGEQLSSCFNIKDKTEFPHIQYLVYHAECPEESCNDDYVGETARPISERVIYHSGKDKNSHILKHQIEKNTLVHNKRILKLLVVVSVITLI